jgi:RHS repeat-associated protein
VVERYTFSAYGLPLIITGPGTDGTWGTTDDVTASASAIGNPYLYTGQRWDPETENHYYKNRYQRPTLGRFISRDPLEYVDGMSTYKYVKSNPQSGFDPSGRVVVVLAGLGQGKNAIRHIGDAIAQRVKQALPEVPDGVAVSSDGGKLWKGKDWLRDEWGAFLKRKKNEAGGCSLEQFVVVGFSDGATAIYNVLKSQKDNFRDEYTTPAYIGFIDLVRTNYGIDKINTKDEGTFTVALPMDTIAQNYRQITGKYMGWKGRSMRSDGVFTKGFDVKIGTGTTSVESANFIVNNAAHLDVLGGLVSRGITTNNTPVIEKIARDAAFAYKFRVIMDIQGRPETVPPKNKAW